MVFPQATQGLRQYSEEGGGAHIPYTQGLIQGCQGGGGHRVVFPKANAGAQSEL